MNVSTVDDNDKLKCHPHWDQSTFCEKQQQQLNGVGSLY